MIVLCINTDIMQIDIVVVKRNNGIFLIKSKYFKIGWCTKYISKLYFLENLEPLTWVVFYI